ncbi:MAG: FliH/SctL family protein [Paracoccaceae bacterium]
MIEDVEKNSNKSLGDNEIASLMKTLASKNYRENVSFPKRVIQPFKPISFLEAANKNLKKNDESIPENKKEIEISKENPESQIAESENESNVQIETNRENLGELESSEPDVSGTTPNDSPENELIENEENTSTSEIEQITPIGIPVKENLYTKDELSKEYQKGYSEGVETEQKKFIEEKENLLKNFNSLIKAIEEKIFIDTNPLEKKIKEEIIKITTERVGLLINEMPEEFLNKIKLLSNTIIKNSGKKIFKLNPEDLKLVKKIIKGETTLEKFVFLADNTLARGDCIIEIGEISIEDKIIDRYDSSESSTRYFEIGNKENIVEEISQSDEVKENESTLNMSEISERENANIEISQKDQDIEQVKPAEFNPDEIIEISEDENLPSNTVNSSNTDQKDQDKT